MKTTTTVSSSKDVKIRSKLADSIFLTVVLHGFNMTALKLYNYEAVINLFMGLPSQSYDYDGGMNYTAFDYRGGVENSSINIESKNI